MSELKAHNTRYEQVLDEVYLKSEADKHILKLKADLVRWEGYAHLSHGESLRKLRHSNYKRCLDKAEMCEARYNEEDAKVNGCEASWEYISNEMKYWERWRWRWLELAEKFKEAK